MKWVKKNNEFLNKASLITGFTFTHEKGVLRILHQSVKAFESLMNCNCDHCKKILIPANKVNEKYWEDSKNQARKDIADFIEKNPGYKKYQRV